MSFTLTNAPSAHCTFNRLFDYELEWSPERHYPAGTQVEVRSGCMRALFSWRYAEISMERADITYRWKMYPGASDLISNRQWVIFRAKLPYGAKPGKPHKIRMKLAPPIWAGIDELLSIWTIPVKNNFRPDLPDPDPIREENTECLLPAVAGPVERLSLYCHPCPGPADKVRCCIVPEDRFGNPGRFESPVAVHLEWEGKNWTLEIGETEIISLDAPASIGRLTAYVPMDGLSALENIANGRREGQNLVVTGNPVWSKPVEGLTPAYGEFHWHTDVSGDGQRAIEVALRSARDYLNMNYAAPGDHNPKGKDWEATVKGLEEYNRPDEFATFFGWENGTDKGHENYYFTDPNHPLVCGGSEGIKTGYSYDLADRLKKYKDFISIPHHTNAVAETRKLEDDSPYWHTYPWMEPTDYIRAVEIMQARGNQERNDYTDAWRGWHQHNNSSVQDALALGHKIGFTGGTDNHCGWPGRGYAKSEAPLGGNNEPKSVILTGLWTKRVERQEIFNALYNRHSWAVWDTRAIVWFTINGALMGDEIEVARNEELSAHIKLSAEDALQTLEIISDGEIIWASSFTELDIEVNVPLGMAVKPTYFYLRGLQRNGGILYASPVFVTVRD